MARENYEVNFHVIFNDLMHFRNVYRNDPDDVTTIDLEVRVSPLMHALKLPLEAGPSISPGRFVWFVPQIPDRRITDDEELLHYKLFTNFTQVRYSNFVISENILQQLKHGSK